MEREDGDEAARHRKLQAQSEGGRLGLGRPPVSMLGVGAGGWGLTQEDLQGIGVQLQGLDLLLHDVHVLCVLVVEAVHAGVGQHLRAPAGSC